MGRFKNRIMARLLTRFSGLFDRSVDKVAPFHVEGTVWTPFAKTLAKARIGLVTTAGVHLAMQEPFDMADHDGDPSFRELPSNTLVAGYRITHDYYDHTDADRDINIVYPIERLAELEKAGVIGGIARVNYGFMGHIDGRHIETLMNKTAPEVARALVSQGVDAVVLTPG